jgi:hypothetical protein
VLVWLGGFDYNSCTWSWDMAKLRDRLEDIKDHPAISKITDKVAAVDRLEALLRDGADRWGRLLPIADAIGAQAHPRHVARAERSSVEGIRGRFPF